MEERIEELERKVKKNTRWRQIHYYSDHMDRYFYIFISNKP